MGRPFCSAKKGARSSSQAAVAGQEHTVLSCARFRLNIWKNFLAKGVIKQWNGLPKEVLELPSLEEFKESLCRGLVDRVVFGHGLDSIISELFSSLIDSVVLNHSVLAALSCLAGGVRGAFPAWAAAPFPFPLQFPVF